MTPIDLHPLARYGLRRLGDLLIAGDAAMPSFSASACITHLPSVLAEMHPADRSDLQIAASLLGLMPHIARRGLLAVLERSDSLPDLLGSPCRCALFNFRALIFSLYYGHPPILASLGYEVAVYLDDLEAIEERQ